MLVVVLGGITVNQGDPKEGHMDTVLERLVDQAYLFDDPGAYEAGVRDAVEAIEASADAQTARVAASMRQHPASGGARRLRSVEHSAA